ncbi:unnamed protein product [Rangifer tarandus platyrhynchus]|uniref:Uncharacterized protein n=2 Tax=Rangifer tarandus platyrhynchus TaxID=3082113 RepID=A0AC59ZZM7_RANTA|nr:unnamed protein product [Rangifer tarandus platyrhynchus]
MASAHICTLGILFMLSGLRAQSVTQPEDQVPVSEGDPVTVKCTYSVSGSPYLFWYVQHRNQGLQLLLKYISGDSLVSGIKGFKAEFKSETTFHLEKPLALWRDSAKYFCLWVAQFMGQRRAEHKLLCFHCSDMLLLLISILGIFALRDSRGQSVTQPDDPVLASEGTSLELKCNYSYGATPYLFWYVQYPRQRPQLLLKYFSGNTVVQGIRGFVAEFKSSEFSFNLSKFSAHWSDSAEYFCALSGAVPGTAEGVEHKPLAVVEFSDTQDRFLFYFKQSFAI